MAKVEQLRARLNGWFDALDRAPIVLFALATILLIAVADAATGSQLRFTMFYILPVWVSSWKLGFGPGSVFAGGGALIGSIVNAAGVDVGPLALAHVPLWLWDLGARFVPLAIVAWLVDALHATILRERKLARLDPLTGALNRRALIEEARRALAHGERLKLATGFLYLDLDGFKAINDQQGHAVGDELLVKFVAAARAKVRQGDLIARLGGDEFVLLLAEATPAGAERAARRVCAELRELALTWQPPVSFSAGLCVVDTAAISDPAVALGAADRMLYAAKSSGSEDDWFRVTRLSAEARRARV
ncbi:MAG: GGDEF domain-containing protein [Geminicoccaceae bacterium]|nr:GGDEF domain-containing protein [Geminicoccaceae bacterium]